MFIEDCERFGLVVVASVTVLVGRYTDIAVVFRHTPTDRLLWMTGEAHVSSIDSDLASLDTNCAGSLRALTAMSWDTFAREVEDRFPLLFSLARKEEFLSTAWEALPPEPTVRKLRNVCRELAAARRELRQQEVPDARP